MNKIREIERDLFRIGFTLEYSKTAVEATLKYLRDSDDRLTKNDIINLLEDGLDLLKKIVDA